MLALGNPHRGTAETENTPKKVIHSHIGPDVAEGAEGEKSNEGRRGDVGNVAHLRISNVKPVSRSVNEAHENDNEEEGEREYTRLGAYLENEARGAVGVFTAVLEVFLAEAVGTHTDTREEVIDEHPERNMPAADERGKSG